MGLRAGQHARAARQHRERQAADEDGALMGYDNDLLTCMQSMDKHLHAIRWLIVLLVLAQIAAPVLLVVTAK
jgi:hypothetical protein